ncbi:MAG: hypothetical protein ACI8ZM_001872 [Crocinitomix sp.]|jgi:hypothetical protein
MTTIELGNIVLVIDEVKTREFYKSQNGFICTCPNCKDFVNKTPHILNILDGIDHKLGIDLHKDVGQGMDELMPIDSDNTLLYVVPYYAVGKCFVNEVELEKQLAGPIWPNTKRASYKLSEKLTWTIINTSESIKIDNVESVITIWFEYKTELIEE